MEIEFLSRKHTYVCTLAKQNNRLKVDIRDKDTNQIWTGDFSRAYIDKLTRKTGCPQSIDQFYLLLEACLQGNFDNTLAEFLSYSDLEKICGRTTQTESSNRHLNRYLILTYILDTKKAQIPLPLSTKIENPGFQEKFIGQEKRIQELERENKRLHTVNSDMKQEFARVKSELDSIITQLEKSNSSKKQVKELETKSHQQELMIASLQSQLAIYDKDPHEPENTNSPQQEFNDSLMNSEQLKSVDIAELVSMFPKVMEMIDNVR